MADSSRTLTLRIISALVAASTLFAMGYFGGTHGLQLAVALVCALGVHEYSRMILGFWEAPTLLYYKYIGACAVAFAALAYNFSWAFLVLMLVGVHYFLSAIWICGGCVSNEKLLSLIGSGLLGLLYCVFFPACAFQFAAFEHGSIYFLLLVLVVFSGDTFAYFGGRFFGRHKMLPAISPSKTWEGAIAGLAGSVLVGMSLCAYALPMASPWVTLLFSILCGSSAQTGDLLISLVKRVVNVKDTGQIMPGHGGILDRLDGVYMACPLVYVFALYVK